MDRHEHNLIQRVREQIKEKKRIYKEFHGLDSVFEANEDLTLLSDKVLAVD